MCEFISWVEKGGKVYFLTGKKIFHTQKGKKLQEWSGSSDDYSGHGAIRYYYGLEQDEGINKECTNFATPTNFPAVIAHSIKKGDMRGLGLGKLLLSKPAWAEYEKVRQQAWAECEKVQQQAFAEYKKAWQQAQAEYEKVEQPAFWDLFAFPENRVPKWR